MPEKMPALFIGHGSPMNIILDNAYTRSLSALRGELPRPEAIMVISAHWLTKNTSVSCEDRPKTIYDFFGFPDELYRVRYPSPGAPDIARKVVELVKRVNVSCSTGWGLDHASWAVLKHMYPRADIPVFEMSLAYSYNEWHPKPLQYHYDLARELRPLREQGVLIIGSGNIVHNLGLIDFENIGAPVFDWAETFDERVKAHLLNGNHDALLHYHDLGQEARLAVPTLDHYLPLIYVLALQHANEPLSFIHEGFQYGSVSMRCFRFS
ncbi:MAG TPA: 4,5-DOPA dioxygenase extradiol [Nitrospirota bacterium]|nr:4,5-DOPA dioxygenase extradiol [Nitrospirota bacterium]